MPMDSTDRPDWWDWEIAFTPHVEARMEERAFSEVELRAMLEDAIGITPARRTGRQIVNTRLAGKPPGQKSVRTHEIGPDLLVDYASDGSPLGIEVVSPGEVTVEEINRAFDELGLGRPSPSDLQPLRAA